MPNEKILIVDDEEYIRKLIKKSLKYESYIIKEAPSGKSAIEVLENESFDLIILDVMLQDTDGFELLKEIKEIGITTPVLFLSARNEEHDKILGLGLGAVNYITKPFSPAVLCAYVKAQIRSFKEYSKADTHSSYYSIIKGPFRFDLKAYKLYKNDILIDLSYKETQLIKFFLENPYQVFTKQQIYENIWSEAIIDDNSVMVYIHNLRKRIEDNPKSPKYLETVWGIGYKFTP